MITTHTDGVVILVDSVIQVCIMLSYMAVQHVVRMCSTQTSMANTSHNFLFQNLAKRHPFSNQSLFFFISRIS